MWRRLRWRHPRRPIRRVDATTVFLAPLDPHRPILLCVSPYAIYPPAHGGARRMQQSYAELSRRFNVVVLSDEGGLYGSASRESMIGPVALFHVRGREETPEQAGHRIGRIESHSRPALGLALQDLVASYAVDAVLVEYIELAGLARYRSAAIPWILDLHDVLLRPGVEEAREADAAELRLMRCFDLVLACSEEDRALLPADLPAATVRNGIDLERLRCGPSPDRPRILYAGPFRYPPNHAGMRSFLTSVFPHLRDRVPGAEIEILGGAEAAEIVACEPCFRQPGVRVETEYVDSAPRLRDCALTVNPMRGIRGSSLKVIESMAARRVCVSTREGARGHLDRGLRGLVLVDEVDDMLDPLVELLADPARRHAREVNPEEAIGEFAWSRQIEFVAEWIAARTTRAS